MALTFSPLSNTSAARTSSLTSLTKKPRVDFFNLDASPTSAVCVAALPVRCKRDESRCPPLRDSGNSGSWRSNIATLAVSFFAGTFVGDYMMADHLFKSPLYQIAASFIVKGALLLDNPVNVATGTALFMTGAFIIYKWALTNGRTKNDLSMRPINANGHAPTDSQALPVQQIVNQTLPIQQIVNADVNITNNGNIINKKDGLSPWDVILIQFPIMCGLAALCLLVHYLRS